MLSLQVPATDPQAQPGFTDAAACESWLSQFQLTDVGVAHETLLAELEQLNRYDLPAAERLKIMELLRETTVFIQDGYSKKIFARPLPLSESELSILKGVLALWQGLVTGYQHCLQACIAGDPQLAEQKALICQRCLRYTGLQIVEHIRACYEFPLNLWQQLHGLYAYTEEQGIADTPVEYNRNEVATLSCSAIYIKTLLTCQANPYELTRKQLQFINRWLDAWKETLIISQTPPAAGEGAPSLAVDLKSSCGIQYQISPSDTARYLDMAALSRVLREKTALLQQGQSPEEAGLGDDCPQPGCGTFLNYLHLLWCEGRFPRFFERHSAAGQAQVCYGMPAIHFYLSGKQFLQPGKKNGSQLTDQERRQLESIGHVVRGSKTASQLGFSLETWEVQDESPVGMRLLFREAEGARVSHNQLIAARPSTAENFVLGVIRRITVTRGGDVFSGIRSLPGVPQPVALRKTGVNVKESEKYVTAFLLPHVPALQIPPSLVTPLGWYKAKRVVEVLTDMPQYLKMLDLIEKGMDYERVSFVTAYEE